MNNASGFKFRKNLLGENARGKSLGGNVFAELSVNIRNAGQRKLTVANNATYRAAEKVLEEAKAIVPHDTGTLELSGKLARGNKKTQWKVIFSATVAERAMNLKIPPEKIYRPDYNYALIQHENTEFVHAPGRTHHYLKIPLEEMARKLAGNIIGAMRRTKAKGRKIKDITEGID